MDKCKTTCTQIKCLFSVQKVMWKTFKLKSKLRFEIEAPFWNWSSISKSKLHFQIEAPFGNQSSISKWKLHFKIKAPFRNGSTIFKWKLHLKIEVLKSKFDFEIEVRFWNLSSILKWKPQKCSVYLSYVSEMAQMEHRINVLKAAVIKAFFKK